MSRYLGSGEDATRDWNKIGVLLVNLGSPDAPEPKALRRYLKEFLWDPRVVEFPRPLWWFVLNGVILNIRPRRSAEAYKTVWTEQGSPLIVISKAQQAAVEERLKQRLGGRVVTALAMRYGNPSIKDGLLALRKQGVGRLVVLPLYPQYSASTSASVFDEVFDQLKTWRLVPEIRTVAEYHLHPQYIDALAKSVQTQWQNHPRSERLLFSFHGIPKRYLKNGDPYYHHCQATAKAVAEKLELNDGEWFVTFQSRFGKEEWLNPYTDKTLTEWAKNGVKSVDIMCPGFSADCLETLEEIKEENREYFMENGGESFNYIAALNDHPDHIRALASIAEEQLADWL